MLEEYGLDLQMSIRKECTTGQIIPPSITPVGLMVNQTGGKKAVFERACSMEK